MSTTLALTFPWGRFHATPWGRNVNEGVPEWPPSPWRLLRALYATWKSRAPELPTDAVLGMLSLLADPPTYVLPPSTEAHTRHFMPDAEHLSTASKAGKNRDKAFDPFVAFERGADVLITWPADLDAEHRAVLGLLAGRLTYVGRAESICDARLVEDGHEAKGIVCTPLTETAEGAVRDRPPIRLLVPRNPLDPVALVVRTTEIRRKGLLDPPGARWVDYERPAEPVSAPSPRIRALRPPTAVKWAIASPAAPSVRAAVTMADCLRRACMARFGRLHQGRASSTLAGKDPAGNPLSGHLHAHYFAVDEDGDGLLDHLVVWAPAGLGDAEMRALGALAHLGGFGFISDFRPARLGLEACGDVERVAPRLVGPARRWRSHTPFAPPRHAKRGISWEDHVTAEVRQELSRRGLPEPMEVELRQGDWLTYRRHRPTTEPLEAARRAVGLKIAFVRPVSGPLALGALSHFGLGLFFPADGP